MLKRKLMLPILAVIVGVAASAFTINPTVDATSKSNETTYWFLMDASGTHVTTTQVTDPSSLCPLKITQANCAREYNESQTEIVNGVRQVKASEEDNQIDFRSKEQ